jgi:hypothetical protein
MVVVGGARLDHERFAVPTADRRRPVVPTARPHISVSRPNIIVGLSMAVSMGIGDGLEYPAIA